MAGDREESATIARQAFKEIAVAGNGTMNFEEFSRLMLNLEDGRGAITAVNDPTRGAMHARSARVLRTRKLVDDFIEMFSRSNEKYASWLGKNVEYDNENDKEENDSSDDDENDETKPIEESARFATRSNSIISRQSNSIISRSNSFFRGRKNSLADMCAPEHLLRKIRDNKETERRKSAVQIEIRERMEKQRRETVKVALLDEELQH